MNAQLVRIRTRKMSVLSSFRASHDDISTADVSPITKKVEESLSTPQRFVPSRTRYENSSAVKVEQLSHDVIAEQSQQVCECSRVIEPILLPFVARLGERPLSIARQQTAEVLIQNPSTSKKSRSEVGLNDRQVTRGSVRSRLDLVVPLQRPQTAPEVAKPCRKKQVALPTQTLVPNSATAFETSQRHGSKPVRANAEVQIIESASENEESSELKGADLEVLLKKQLQLVRKHSASSLKFHSPKQWCRYLRF
jgi:hypothetical protein